MFSVLGYTVAEVQIPDASTAEALISVIVGQHKTQA